MCDSYAFSGFIYEPHVKYSAAIRLNLKREPTNQSETREAGPFEGSQKFFHVPTSDINFVVVLCGEFLAKLCDSPAMGLLYCKCSALFLCIYGLFRVFNHISRSFAGVLLACFVSLARALYGPQTDVVQLTANNFRSMVMDSDSVWLVEFFAPWYV